jgi:DNA anti-recombination protein RmuC
LNSELKNKIEDNARKTQTIWKKYKDSQNQLKEITSEFKQFKEMMRKIPEELGNLKNSLTKDSEDIMLVVKTRESQDSREERKKDSSKRLIPLSFKKKPPQSSLPSSDLDLEKMLGNSFNAN